MGIPDITPVPLNVRFVGNGPAVTVHEYGGTPPVAANVLVYGTPCVPAVNEVVVIWSGGVGLIVMVKAAVAMAGVLSESVTCTVMG